MSNWTPTQPLPPRRRTGRTVLIVLGVLLGGCCVASGTTALVSRVLNATPAAGPDVAGDAAAGVRARPGLGQPVRDGQFEFVVRAVTCGQATLDHGWLHAQAKGQFCVVDLTVTNIGTEARNFGDGLQRATGPAGERYAADSGAGVVANGNGEAIWNVVNPGITLPAKVVYDIPAAATITAVELHDSALSSGVTVTVSA